MPHLNEIQDKFDSRGLSVLGVTREGESDTRKFAEENAVKYAYAYDKASKLAGEMGVSGIPNAILVSAAGQVVWQGNPGGLNDAIIEEHLEGALPKPVWEWPKEAAAVRKALQKKQLKKAIDEAEKLSGQEDTAGIAEALRKLVAGRAAALEESYNQGDFLTASENAKVIAKECAGLEAAATANEIAKKISADSQAKAVMKAQSSVRKLKEEQVKRKKDAEELIKKLEKISKKFEGSAAAAEADEFIARLQQSLDRLP